MKHVFTPGADRGDDRRWIESIRQRGGMVEGPTSLWAIRVHLVPQARNLLRTGDQGAMLHSRENS